MTNRTSNNQEYTWTVGDVRALDNRLTKIDGNIEQIKEELAVKNHVVVDNRTQTDWKGIAAVITAVIAATILTLEQILAK